VEEEVNDQKKGIFTEPWLVVVKILKILIVFGLLILIGLLVGREMGWFQNQKPELIASKDSSEVARLKSIPMERKAFQVGDRWISSASGSEFIRKSDGISRFFVAGKLVKLTDNGEVVLDVGGQEMSFIKQEDGSCSIEEVTDGPGRKLTEVECDATNLVPGVQVFVNVEVGQNNRYEFDNLSFYKLE